MIAVTEIPTALKEGRLNPNDVVEFQCRVGVKYSVFGRTLFQAHPLPGERVSRKSPKKPTVQSILVRVSQSNRDANKLLGIYQILQVKGRVRWMHAPTEENPDGVFILATEVSVPSSSSSPSNP